LPNAANIDDLFDQVFDQMKAITGTRKPKQPSTTKKWLAKRLVKNNVFSKGRNTGLIDGAQATDDAKVLQLRQMGSKTSTKKYVSMLNCACDDSRARAFQFTGANRTGRWAGRLIQMQNPPQPLDTAKSLTAWKT
jgi:DNA polymerase